VFDGAGGGGGGHGGCGGGGGGSGGGVVVGFSEISFINSYVFLAVMVVLTYVQNLIDHKIYFDPRF
jgi:hypothetical protein